MTTERSEILQSLTGLMRDVFDNESLSVDESTTAEDIEEWDSLSNIDLIVAIEGEFGITVTTQEVKNLSNVGDLVQLIGGHTKE